MRLSPTERDALFRLLIYPIPYNGDLMAGLLGKVPNQRTLNSLFDKNLLLSGTYTGSPSIDFNASEWDCGAGRAVIDRTQDYLDCIDLQGDPDLLYEDRISDKFSFLRGKDSVRRFRR